MQRLFGDANETLLNALKKGNQERRHDSVLGREKIFRYGESNPELPRSGVSTLKGGNVSRYTIPDVI